MSLRQLGPALLGLWLAPSCAALACSSALRAPSAAPAALGDLTQALPEDLDAAIYVTMPQGRGAGSRVLEQQMARITASYPEATRSLLELAVRRSTHALFGFRPATEFAGADGVAIFKGDFRGVQPQRWGWALEQDLGGVWRSYRGPASSQRHEPVKLYAQGDDVLVFVSAGALDSLSLKLEGGVNPVGRDRRVLHDANWPGNAPPAPRGNEAASCVLRSRGLRQADAEAPVLARCLGSADVLRAWLESEAGVWLLRLEVTYPASVAAERAAPALLDCLRADAEVFGLALSPSSDAHSAGARFTARLVVGRRVAAPDASKNDSVTRP